jgi:phosphoenolpyruvate phosphomutase
MYYSTPTEVFDEAGISLVIWANHILRSAITTMQATARRLHAEQSLMSIEDEVVPVKEIFRLQGAAELQEAEKRYLPKVSETAVIVLAASKGKDFGSLTDDKPKCMIPVKGTPVLEDLVEKFHAHQIKNISVVTGYKPEAIQALGVKTFHNPDYAETGELASLLAAEEKLKGNVIISYGDIAFRSYVLANLLESTDHIAVVIDGSKKNVGSHKALDLVKVSSEYQPSFVEQSYKLVQIDPFMSPSEAHGEWIGLVKLDETGVKIFTSAIKALELEDPSYRQRSIPHVLNFIVQSGRGEVAVQYTYGDWLDLDDVKDLVP